MSRTPGALIAAVVVVALFPDQVSAAVDWLSEHVHQPSKVAAPQVPAIDSKTAKAAGLKALEDIHSIPDRPARPGYSRAQFGPAWTDNHDGLRGHDGCDTRNNMRKASMVEVKTKPGTHGCVVLSGVLPYEPYTGKVNVGWSKEHAADLQVDHVLPLSLAWDLGADQWTAAKRVNFANDQSLNLALVDGKANQAKGDKPPSVWMPANRVYACQYASRFAGVAAAYGLPLPAADIESLRFTLTNACQ